MILKVLQSLLSMLFLKELISVLVALFPSLCSEQLPLGCKDTLVSLVFVIVTDDAVSVGNLDWLAIIIETYGLIIMFLLNKSR